MWVVLSLFFALWSSIYYSILKKISSGLHPAVVLFSANLFALPFMIGLIFLLNGFPHVTFSFFLFMVASSILDLFAFLLSIWALKKSPLSLLSPIASFSPVFTALIASSTLHEIPTLFKFLGILIVVIGAYLLNISNLKEGLFAPIKKLFLNRGVQLFFVANFLWAITPIFQKQAIFQTIPSMPLTASFAGFSLVTIYLIPFIIFKKKRSTIKIIKKHVGLLIFMGIFTALSQLAAYTAFSLANVGYVTAIFKLSSLMGIVWGALFFRETRIKEKFIGGTIMLLGAILLAI